VNTFYLTTQEKKDIEKLSWLHLFFWKVKKLFFKFLCICLLLKKLINEKYFLVNEKHFPVKEKFGLISRKVFFILFWAENTFRKL
jgi:hypothetical protein